MNKTWSVIYSEGYINYQAWKDYSQTNTPLVFQLKKGKIIMKVYKYFGLLGNKGKTDKSSFKCFHSAIAIGHVFMPLTTFKYFCYIYLRHINKKHFPGWVIKIHWPLLQWDSDLKVFFFTLVGY